MKFFHLSSENSCWIYICPYSHRRTHFSNSMSFSFISSFFLISFLTWVGIFTSKKRRCVTECELFGPQIILRMWKHEYKNLDVKTVKPSNNSLQKIHYSVVIINQNLYLFCEKCAVLKNMLCSDVHVFRSYSNWYLKWQLNNEN